ncbi:MAG: nucleotidyltransferase substrate binding protein [Chitinivibrionia bacterium]|nr:nucleotidyltransferase substrate binding protein [Chitinivibrionia bacterium]
MGIDIISLKKALATLEEVVVEYEKDRNNAFVRDSFIKRFEYTYELSTRALKRYLRETVVGISEDDLTSFKACIRMGLSNGLLKSSLEKWNEYREARNLSVHTYEIKNAEIVIEVAFDFAKEARIYVDELEKRIEKENENE